MAFQKAIHTEFNPGAKLPAHLTKQMANHGGDTEYAKSGEFYRHFAREMHANTQDVLSKAGRTPYAGRTVRGRVVRTYLRGTPVAEEGRPLRERAGRLLRGAGATPGRD